jgi:uncharacterized protein YukE
MPQAVANPEDIRQFARQLQRFNDQLGQNMSQLNNQFSRLGETWRDQEHKKFAEEFKQTMHVINRFRQSSEQQIPFLLRKAEHIDKYLHQR